jgi:isopentenyl-diphosphate delta-isomerase type 1
MTATEHVILVDENDNSIGTAEKLEAHRKNLRHRAFSIFIFKNELLLLQQRAAGKYHCANLWTNTCCSHPRPGEDILTAGKRRLKEEMGIETDLKSVGRFHYIAHFDNGLVENEIDHVLVGFIEDQPIHVNPEEVQACRWISVDDLKNEMAEHPERFTPWLAEALDMLPVVPRLLRRL